METDARTHSNDEVADEEGDDLDPVDWMGAEPEDRGDGAGEGQADQEGVVDALLESGTARPSRIDSRIPGMLNKKSVS